MAEKKSVGKDGEEYELVPKKQLDYLLNEVEKLKRNPLGEGQHARDLYDMMAQVNANLQKFVSILQGASDEIVRDYRDETQSHKLNVLMKQNEKLGEGVLLIADLLKELKEHFMKEREQPAPNPFKEQSAPQAAPGGPGAVPGAPTPPGAPPATPDVPPSPTSDWGPPPGQASAPAAAPQDAWATPPPPPPPPGAPQAAPGGPGAVPGAPTPPGAPPATPPGQEPADPFASFNKKGWDTQ